jgi:hypothetical protein
MGYTKQRYTETSVGTMMRIVVTVTTALTCKLLYVLNNLCNSDLIMQTCLSELLVV